MPNIPKIFIKTINLFFDNKVSNSIRYENGFYSDQPRWFKTWWCDMEANFEKFAKEKRTLEGNNE